MSKTKDDLINEIAALEKENHELKAAIKRIDDKELFETVRTYTRRYQKCFYRKIPFSFLNTVFYTQKDTLKKYASGCFIEKVLDVAYERHRALGQKELIMHIPMYCSNVFFTSRGAVFNLLDPYRAIITKPSKRITEESAKNCKGRILIAKLVIPENHRSAKAFELREYKLLKMSLTHILGKEQPVDYNTLFTQFVDVTAEKDAIHAIDVIEDYYRKHDQFMTLRINENNLRVITNEKKIGVSYEKGQLWYGEEPTNYLLLFKALGNAHPDKFGVLNTSSPFLFDDEKLCSY